MTRPENSGSSRSSGPSASAIHPSPSLPANDVGSTPLEELGPLRKAAILVVSLEQPLASLLLAQLDRSAVEAVTLEIARLERIAPEEQRSVLEEFYGLSLRRLRFVFEDLIKMDDRDIRDFYDADDVPVWALALVGAAKPLRAKVLGALPPAAAEDLHDQGHLTLPDPSGQEAMLV